MVIIISVFKDLINKINDDLNSQRSFDDNFVYTKEMASLEEVPSRYIFLNR